MKKISYILILFASLFIVNNVVKAATFNCSDTAGNIYTFTESGGIESFRGKNIKIKSPSPYNSGGYIDTYADEYVASTVKNNNPYDPKEIHDISLGTENVKFGVCPKPEELHYTIVDDYNNCKVTVDRAYYCRNSIIKCDNSEVGGCSNFEDYTSCSNNPNFSCVWVERETGKVLNENVDKTKAYCNVDNLQYVQCKNTFDIPKYLPRITSLAINLLKIATPIILIFVSVITLLSAIIAEKEDEMEKAKKILIRRLGIAALIFFVITITQFVINKVADDAEASELSSCLKCFINNECEVNTYYKNNIDGKYKCIYTDYENSTHDFEGECN